MLSRPPMNASIVLQNSSLTHESYVEQYAEDKYFKNVYASLTHCISYITCIHTCYQVSYHFMSDMRITFVSNSK